MCVNTLLGCGLPGGHANRQLHGQCTCNPLQSNVVSAGMCWFTLEHGTVGWPERRSLALWMYISCSTPKCRLYQLGLVCPGWCVA